MKDGAHAQTSRASAPVGSHLRDARARQPATHGDSDLDTDDDMASYVKEAVERAPPLSSEQRDKLAVILRSNRRTQ